MAKVKAERVKEAAGRSRGCFVSVYELMDAQQAVERFGSDARVMVQQITENAACKNQVDAKAQVAADGLIGTFVAMRRVGTVFQRVIQQVTAFVTPKNEEGFNEESAKQKGNDDGDK